ncbi:hypothetical protein [Actinokineospora sp. NBRC 105648]|uniref:hypothetical protein n=1 Tax=Actinokineospora sp. NBRC 105648 TaxID=3032206 RepID=UPI0024A08AFA|nr:hypothetical protein [Actinokineospora sp. NBRC 105648]GLZ36407.1 hypothetical protein Acsp05_00320 [Actinokineospora sp. NBRC 105648]
MGATISWGVQHDRLLTFVYRTFDCCVRDPREASDLTVELFGEYHRLIDNPDLDDEQTRAVLVPLMAAALRERSSQAAIRAAVGHAAWEDRRTRAGADPHALLDAVRVFTRHLRVPA